MAEKELLTTSTKTALPHHRLSRYGPLAFWAILIFIGSTSVLSASNTSVIMRFIHWLFPQIGEATLQSVHFAIRKAGHFTEYAILGVLAARAFRTSSHEPLHRAWFWASLTLIIVYALSDEFHQSFIPSRTASIFDSMIDSFGGLVALTVIWLTKPRREEPNVSPARDRVVS